MNKKVTYLFHVVIIFLFKSIHAEYDCSAQDDGWYYDPDFCHIYWRCIHGTSEEFECASGTAWDHHENRCNWLDNVDCSRAEKTTVKIVVDDGNENSSEEAHHNSTDESEDQPTVVKKSKKKKKNSRKLNSDKRMLPGEKKNGLDLHDHLLHDMNIHIYIYITYTSLPVILLIIFQTNASTDFLCAGRDGFFAHPEYCTRYYRCSHGIDEVFECPRGTAWDEVTKSCAWVEQVDYTTTSSKNSDSDSVSSGGNPPSAVSSTNGKDGGAVVIECQPTGIYTVPDPAECNAYYQCDKGVRTRVVCPEKTFFETEKRECMELERVSCGTRAINPADKNQCVNKRDGIYPDTERDCHYYYQCVEQNKLREAKCAGDNKFSSYTGRCGPVSTVPMPCGRYVPGNFATKSHQTIHILSIMMILFVIFYV
ncbi:unnamed protein product [Adineta ricciae]|uniref:Chitin-binding type-2 domain-containing protein n=1 Tax=Adineta ricciae TaxID=249248 RepID=A0A816C720_ADIRI|nr:unnamed protein product [Adineta ricciae]